VTELAPDSPRLVEIQASCPLCGAKDARPYATHPEILYVKCSCGLIYRKAALEAPTNTALGDTALGNYRHRLRRRVSKSRHQILDALNHVAPGPLLDIGCAYGYTLQAARDLGLEAAGLELDEEVARRGRQLGYRVEVGTMTQLPFGDGSMQIITMKHVLEHTPDPRSALHEVGRVLKPGGALFIAVPHAAYNKAVRNPQTSRFYLPDGLGTQGGHFIYYTPATLSRLLGEEGFDVVHVHPHLWHRAASLPVQLGQALVAPLRWLAQQAAEGFGLRKEFWLVAVKRAATTRNGAATN